MKTQDVAFLFEGGSIALDFVNTRRMHRGRMVDGLQRANGLRDWLNEAGLGSPALSELSTDPPAMRLLLSEAMRLRDEILYGIASMKSGEPLPRTTLHTLNRVLRVSHTTPSVERSEQGLNLVMRETGSNLLTSLAPVALSAAELFTAHRADRLRQCDADTCVLWFLDTSKNGRRRWCSMARCGNRTKVKRHWEKQQAAPSVHEGAVPLESEADASPPPTAPSP